MTDTAMTDTAAPVQNLAIYGDIHFDWSTFIGQLVGFAVRPEDGFFDVRDVRIKRQNLQKLGVVDVAYETHQF